MNLVFLQKPRNRIDHFFPRALWTKILMLMTAMIFFSTMWELWHQTCCPEHLLGSARRQPDTSLTTNNLSTNIKISHYWRFINRDNWNNTSDIIMVPSIASLRSVKVIRTVEMTRCILSISCFRKIFRGCRLPYFFSLSLT